MLSKSPFIGHVSKTVAIGIVNLENKSHIIVHNNKLAQALQNDTTKKNVQTVIVAICNYRKNLKHCIFIFVNIYNLTSTVVNINKNK